jgi:hypothetical protein
MFISMFIFLLFLASWLSSHLHPSPCATPLQLHFLSILSCTALLFGRTVPQLFNVTVYIHQITLGIKCPWTICIPHFQSLQKVCLQLHLSSRKSHGSNLCLSTESYCTKAYYISLRITLLVIFMPNLVSSAYIL